MSEKSIGKVFVYPGQGSQSVGMQGPLIDSGHIAISKSAKKTFGAANEILGYDLVKACGSGTAEQLAQTELAQPAIFTTSMAAHRALAMLGMHPDAVLGHSLGEYTASVAAGAFTFEDGLRLVQARGKLMSEAGKNNPGSMVAVLKLPLSEVQAICNVTGVFVANINSPTQVVISGGIKEMEEAKKVISSKNGKAVNLNVSIASHCPLMEPTVEGMAKALNKVKIYDPFVPIIQNLTGEPAETADQIKKGFLGQLTTTVQLLKSVNFLTQQGATGFVEVGPGKVLQGLIGNINNRLLNPPEVIGYEDVLKNNNSTLVLLDKLHGEGIKIHGELKFSLIGGRYVLGVVIKTNLGAPPKVFGFTNLTQDSIDGFLRMKRGKRKQKKLPKPQS